MISLSKLAASSKCLTTSLILTCVLSIDARSEEGGDPFIPGTPLFDEDNWYRDLRVGHWLSGGTDLKTIEGVLKRIRRSKGTRKVPEWADTQLEYGPGNWVYEWSNAARSHELLAHKRESQGKLIEARDLFLEAANLYGIAKYPHLNTPEDDSAYKAQLRTYEAAGRLLSQPLEVVEIVIDGTVATGYLHLPEAAGPGNPVPVVLISGGIDVFKAEFYLLAKELNLLGVAAFTHDMKSTGEATYQLLESDYYRYHLAYAEELASHPSIDPSRIAVYGQSFGGNPVAKLAVDHDDVFSAAIVACAPLNLPFLAFSPEQLPFALEPMTLDILEARFRTKSCDTTGSGQQQCADILDALETFALGNALATGSIDIPLLVPAPANDPFMPEPDIDLLFEASNNTAERLITGQDIHCTRERDTYWPQIAAWIASFI